MQCTVCAVYLITYHLYRLKCDAVQHRHYRHYTWRIACIYDERKHVQKSCVYVAQRGDVVDYWSFRTASTWLVDRCSTLRGRRLLHQLYVACLRFTLIALLPLVCSL